MERSIDVVDEKERRAGSDAIVASSAPLSVVCKTLANAWHWHLLPPHHILHRKTNKHQYIDIIVKFEALKPPKYEYSGVAMSGRHSSRSRPSTPPPPPPLTSSTNAKPPAAKRARRSPWKKSKLLRAVPAQLQRLSIKRQYSGEPLCPILQRGTPPFRPDRPMDSHPPIREDSSLQRYVFDAVDHFCQGPQANSVSHKPGSFAPTCRPSTRGSVTSQQ